MARLTAPAIFLEPQFISSEAFRSLNGTAIIVLLRFLQKRRLEKTKWKRRDSWRVINNGDIVFTYDEAEDMGLSRNQFRDAKYTLLERGFISESPLEGGLFRKACLYWVHVPDSEQRWMDWKPLPKKSRRNPPVGFEPGHKLHPSKRANSRKGGKDPTTSSGKHRTEPG
jgi:hypothetical protein